MQSFWLAPESVPLVSQPFLVPTAMFYSIHTFSTLSVLLAFCCCSPRFLSMSLASEAGSSSNFSSPLSCSVETSSFYSSSQVFSSSICILYPSPPSILQLREAGLAISHTSFKYFDPLPPVLSSLSLFKFQFLSSLLSSSPYFSILALLSS